ncbi:MFS transporter [Acidocella sp.]|uniref:MFS transporter n=1 Tax=Acidocella sp. TaxID=50710 RepID=UPI00261562F3|nr:MFS transporter [Acidocella sp.]
MASLWRARRFLPLFITQALGALNDNLFKNALVILALARLPAHQAAALAALSGGLFLLPYALLSASMGQMADAFEKTRLIRLVKLWELGLMLLALAGFLTGSFALLVAVLFGLGMQAAAFSPLKYGILPEFFSADRLVIANGYIEAGTFMGIIIGTVLGGGLILVPGGRLIVPALAMAIALGGIASAWAMPRSQVAAPGLRPGWHMLRETRALLASARANRPVWLASLAISWFWAFGALVLGAFPVLAEQTLHAGAHAVTLMLGIFAIGVGVGSVLAGRLTHDAHLLRLTLPAGVGMSLCAGLFALIGPRLGVVAGVAGLLTPGGLALLAVLAGLSVCGGLFSVPFYVRLQEASPPAARARMVAANNVLNALITFGAGALGALAFGRGVGAPAVLLALCAANLAVMAALRAFLRS